MKTVLSCADKCHESAQDFRALALASLRANFHNRRKFLALAGLTGTGLGLAACAQKPAAVPTAMAGMEGGSPTPSGAGYEEMDKMHKAGVDTFVANAGKDPTFWRQPLTPKVDGDVKVFEITVLNDAGVALTLNGKSFPHTQPIIAKTGQTIRVRYMNEGLQNPRRIRPRHVRDGDRPDHSVVLAQKQTMGRPRRAARRLAP